MPVWLLDPEGRTVTGLNDAAALLPGAPRKGASAAEIDRFLLSRPDLTRQPLWLADAATGAPVPAIMALSDEGFTDRLALHAAGHVVFDWEIGTNRLTWHCQAGQAFGPTPETFPTRLDDWLAMVHPEDRARLSDTAQGTLPGPGQISETRYRLIRPDGSIAHVMDRGTVVHDARTGAPLRMIGAMIDVSEVNAVETRFRAATSATADVLFLLDFENGTFWWSDALSRIYGHDPAAQSPDYAFWLDLIHPDDRERVRTRHAALLAAKGTAWEIEYRYRRADGTYAQVMDRTRFRYDAQGRIALIVGNMVDITELREEQERARLALEAGRDAIYWWDLTRDEVRRSENFGPLFGLPLESPPEDWVAQIHRDDRARVLEARDAALAAGENRYEIAYRVHHRETGQVVHVIDRALASRDAAGQVQRVVGSIVDISRLRKEQERLRAVLQVASDMFYELDLRNNIITFSEGAKRVFGHDWVGTHPRPSPWDEAIHPEDASEIRTRFRLFLASPRDDWRGEYRMRRGNGTYAHVRDKAVMLRDDEGQPVKLIGSIDDVTDEVEAETRLRQAQKMDAIGKLTGGVAHDFNNLLTVILGNAEALAEAAAQPGLRPETLTAMAEAIQQAASRGAELVASLLSYARKQPLRPRPLDPATVIAELRQLMRRILPAWITLEIQAPDNLLTIRADPAQLQAALLNLVLNACDAMPTGGRLTISAMAVTLGRREVASNPTALPGRFLRLSIADTGPGMSEEVAARAFDPFFTTKPVGQGSGLGLSMVQGFASQSGGLVSLQSQPGQGTSVTLFLPEAGAEPVFVRADLPRDAVPVGRGEHLLVAEDDAALRPHVARMIEGLGYRVTAVPDGTAALDAMRRAGDVALLFTDLVMPGDLPGGALAERALSEFPGLRVLFTSGYSEVPLMSPRWREGGLQLLSKPYRRADLARKLAEVLAAPPLTSAG